jgi:two-component system, OmpR family, response regulator
MVHVEVAPRGRARPRHILVVDDAVEVTDGLSDVLGRLGHRVHTALDGPRALATVDEVAPEVVLLDLGLPGMSGVEVAGHIRRRAPMRDAVLVAITGWGSDRDPRAVREAGFDHYLVKPLGMASLVALVGDASAGWAPSPPEAWLAQGSGVRPMLSTLVELMATADRAAASNDGEALARAVHPLMAITREDLAIDLVAVLELARYDVELARKRWTNLRGRIRHPAR